MTDTIEKVTLENAADQLKSKIRLAFVELLTDEQWTAMVQTELTRFTQSHTERNTYSSQSIEVPSDFSKICREIFSEYVKTELKALLATTEWQQKWGFPDSPRISDALKAWLTDNSVALIQSTVQALATAAAQNVVNSLQHLR